ncbi:hypothetical protein QOZ84_00110 [Romboutsia sedimentorum]|uniref:Uncharacterized protein n=1 Tax=Romboutsia sedimentorum TaxID=1368474 RepID=A0ABT7E4T1_9FIRM|nr:hypothetical protein [Romboutsia sedimentorum]MDK2561935.1 hypothetical protein [Romboutsia sedimentorum]MDK2586729.1 hypothetical protein [Romboutsia sedimentorum]
MFGVKVLKFFVVLMEMMYLGQRGYGRSTGDEDYAIGVDYHNNFEFINIINKFVFNL